MRFSLRDRDRTDNFENSWVCNTGFLKKTYSDKRKRKQQKYSNYCCCHHSQSEVGTQLYETLGLEGEISLAIRKLKEWAAPRPVEKNLLTLSDTVYIKPEPLGVVLIIGAWNYPWAVTIQPLIGAIAAGTEACCRRVFVGERAAFEV